MGILKVGTLYANRNKRLPIDLSNLKKKTLIRFLNTTRVAGPDNYAKSNPVCLRPHHLSVALLHLPIVKFLHFCKQVSCTLAYQ
jgi:hypothetical protein